jgi:hypothetical protein
MEPSYEQYAKGVLQQAFADLKDIDESGGWEVFGHGKKVEQMRKPSDVLFLFRGICTVPLDHETVRDFLKRPENRPKYSTDIKEVVILETFDDGTVVNVNKIWTPPGVSNRDSVTVFGVMQDEEENIYIAERSVEHKGYPEQNGYVRVNLMMSGFVIRPIGPRECTLSFVFNLDPRGSLPEGFVRMVQKKEAKMPGYIRDLLKKGER